MPKRASDIWDHYQVMGGTGHKKHVVCIYCDKEYTYSHATRMMMHIIKCKSCPNDIKLKFMNKNKSRNETSSVNSNIFSQSSSESLTVKPSLSFSTESETSILVPCDDNSRSFDGNQPQYVLTRPKSAEIENNDFNKKDQIDASIARAIYSSGVPLSLLESNYWKEALKCLNTDYNPPSRHSISNTLLDAEYTSIKSQIDEKIRNSSALAIITDRWTNIHGKGVINFVISTPELILYKSIYLECEKETAEYMCSEIIKVIEDIGPSKTVAFITDNGKTMKAAWRLVHKQYPKIACIGCVAQALNLIYKDINKLSSIKKYVDNVIKVIKYVMNKHRTMALFEKIQTTVYGILKQSLKLPCKEMWNSVVISLESFINNKEALKALAITKENSVEKDLKVILLDDEMWLKVKNILKVLKPITSAIIHAKSGSARVSDVPIIFLRLSASIEDELQSSIIFDDSEKEMIKKAILKRQEFGLQPIHLAANLLDPRYLGSDLTSDQECTASNYIHDQAEVLGKDPVLVMTNVAEFRTKTAFFGKCHSAWVTINKIAPQLWWQSFASKQELFPIAFRFLSIRPSSVASERNWRLLATTNTNTRNMLEKEKVNKLIMVRQNLKYLDNTISTASDEDQLVDFDPLYSDYTQCVESQTEYEEENSISD